MQSFDWKAFLLSFEGRITRSDYWLRFALPYVVLLVIAGIFDGVLGTYIGSSEIGIIYAVYSIAVIWPSIAVGAKRCHDRNRSGWFQLIALIPILGAIWLLVELGFLRGTIGPNRFGPDALQGGAVPAQAD